ncbi:MAG: hypothetical protein C0154_00965 [Mucilaginibacter sp.]|nr:MAG: hypothetical protein C0154_00965 [Mucilaginibacter sp.]HEK19953.1 hypothetical protein [Bacteroidota bacterium]
MHSYCDNRHNKTIRCKNRYHKLKDTYLYLKIKKHIAILGGGPSSLFIFKRFVESGEHNFTISIFEKSDRLGAGMPYSRDGANDEHVTNVSGNEIPDLVTSLNKWIKSVPRDTLDKYHIDPEKFNDYKVLPRLLFGQYLTEQFKLLQRKANEKGIEYEIFYNSCVTDIVDHPNEERVKVTINHEQVLEFDIVIISTGHNWPKKNEDKIKGYYDSPYPPAKLAQKINHPVAIKGSSLTAIDAIRTLSRHNGHYHRNEDGHIIYQLHDDSPDFKMIMHSRNGLLPAVRFHLEDPHLSKNKTLTPQQIKDHRAQNNGFLSLDYIFEQDFKLPLKTMRPAFYEEIKGMNMEEFVGAMMALRESIPPFELLKIEYDEAEASIAQRKSVYWKEMLAILSFAMNYPAKYFSAEDMLRIQKTLMPLISVVIAFVPQSSAEEMMALYNAGVLEIITVGDDSYVEPADEATVYHYNDAQGKPIKISYKTFIDSTGQQHFVYDDFPFKGLVKNRTLAPAGLRFKDLEKGLIEKDKGNKNVYTDHEGNYYLQVPGIAINDNFEAVDSYGALNERIYIMAVPYIGGYNPDYSGLDFGEAASDIIVKSILNHEPAARY